MSGVASRSPCQSGYAPFPSTIYSDLCVLPSVIADLCTLHDRPPARAGRLVVVDAPPGSSRGPDCASARRRRRTANGWSTSRCAGARKAGRSEGSGCGGAMGMSEDHKHKNFVTSDSWAHQQSNIMFRVAFTVARQARSWIPSVHRFCRLLQLSGNIRRT